MKTPKMSRDTERNRHEKRAGPQGRRVIQGRAGFQSS
jgi:hypothetical protein